MAVGATDGYFWRVEPLVSAGRHISFRRHPLCHDLQCAPRSRNSVLAPRCCARMSSSTSSADHMNGQKKGPAPRAPLPLPPSSPKMDRSTETVFPNEIWMATFESMDRPTLKSGRLVCHLFASLSWDVLLQDITWSTRARALFAAVGWEHNPALTRTLSVGRSSPSMSMIFDDGGCQEICLYFIY